MNDIRHIGAVPIGGPQRLMIVEHTIIAPAQCGIRTNGLTMPGCAYHLRVIDIHNARAILVPATENALRMIADDATALLRGDEPIHTRENQHDHID